MGGVRKGPISGADLAIFSSPMLVYQAVETPWRLYIPAFLTTSVGLSLAATAALMFWIKLFETFLEPVLGIASDHLHGPFGRRRPWMAVSVPLLMVGAVLVFFLPAGVSFSYILLAAMLLHLGHVMLVTPHGGWSLELAVSASDATRVMGAKMWAFALGLPLTLAVPAMVEWTVGGGLSSQIAAMGILVIVTAPLAVVAVLTRVRERGAPDIAEPWRLARRSLVRLLLRRDLALILLLYAMLGAADAAEGAATLFFIERGLGIQGWTGTLLLVPAILGLFAIPVWTALAMRFDRRRMLAITLVLRTVFAPLALLLPDGQPLLLAAYLLARSLAWGADYLILRAMVSDLVRSGSGAECERSANGYAATHYALFNIANKLAGALGVAGTLATLGTLGFDPGVSAQVGNDTLLRAIYALPSCVAGLIGLAALTRMKPAQRRQSDQIVS